MIVRPAWKKTPSGMERRLQKCRSIALKNAMMTFPVSDRIEIAHG